MADIEWTPLTSAQQLREAHQHEEDVIVRISRLDNEIRPLAMWFGLMVGDQPFLIAAMRRGMSVELAQVHIHEVI